MSLKDYFNYFARHNLLFYYHLKRVTDIYEYDPDKITELKNLIFINQFKYAYNNSKFYKKIYKEHGITKKSIQSLEDIKTLPVIEKNDIVDKIDELLIAGSPLIRKGFTSGTTGSPLTVYRDYNSILTENAYLSFFKIRNGVKIGDPVVSLRGTLLRNQLKHYERPSNTLYLSGYNINEKDINLYISEILKFGPVAIIGYPSSIYSLALEFEKKNVKIEIPIGFTSSENLNDIQVKKVKEVFNMNLCDWYGNSERTIALEGCGDHYHEVPLYSFNEFDDDKIITTSFINKHFPLIRYVVHDIVNYNNNAVCNKINTKIISKIDGRSSDYIRLKDGSIVNRLNQVFAHTENISYAQLVQYSYEFIDVNLVVNDLFTKKDHDNIYNYIYSRTGDMIKIKINTITEDKIIKTTSGKYRLVVNKLTA